MDALEFLNEEERMSKIDPKAYNKLAKFFKNAEVVAYVENWSKAHPRKTRLQDFLEKYPKAILEDSGIPKGTCCRWLGYTTECVLGSSNCFRCWDSPLEN